MSERQGGRIRDRLPDLALEALMVVFAVLVALAVDEWREGRQLRELADRARAAVLIEARANLGELERTRPQLVEVRLRLRATADSLDARRDASIDVSMELPEFTSAAWQAAQVTQAAPYLDYDWVIRVARAYEQGRIYEQLRSELLGSLSGSADEAAPEAWVSRIAGQLDILLQVHAGLEERLRGVVAEG